MARLSSIKTAGGGSNMMGVYLTQTECKLRTYNLSWDQPTIFKPMPIPNDDHTGVLGAVSDEDPDVLTDWLVELPRYVRAAGSVRRVTFLAKLPSDEEGYTEHPYERLVRVVKEEAKADTPEGARYDKMLKGGPGAGPAVPNIKSVAAMQGILYMHNGKDYTRDPKQDILLCLSPSGTSNFGTVISLNDEDGTPAIETLFDEGIPKLIHFSKSDTAFTLPPGWDLVCSNPKDDEASTDSFKHHVARVVTTPAKRVTVPNQTEYATNHFVEWQTALRYMSVKEVLELLASAYEYELIIKVFMNSEYEDLLPAWILKKIGDPRAGQAAAAKPKATPAALKTRTAPLPAASPEVVEDTNGGPLDPGDKGEQVEEVTEEEVTATPVTAAVDTDTAKHTTAKDRMAAVMAARKNKKTV